MPTFFKQGMSVEEANRIDSSVRETVHNTLENIVARGDAAVRDLSERFDKWSPSFRLSDEEVERLVQSVPGRTL